MACPGPLQSKTIQIFLFKWLEDGLGEGKQKYEEEENEEDMFQEIHQRSRHEVFRHKTT